jgi:predicted acyltransferase
MLIIQIYLLIGLIVTLYGITYYRSKYHTITKPWTLGCVILTVAWLPILIHDLWELVEEQIKWKLG